MERVLVQQDQSLWLTNLLAYPQGLFLKVQPVDTTAKILNVELTAVPDPKKQCGIINLHWTFDDSSKDPYWILRLDAYKELIPDGDILNISITEASTKSCMKRQKVDKLYPVGSRFIRVEGNLIPVSKEVLALFSPNYFRKLFYNEDGRAFKEPNKAVVKIKEQNYEDMKCLLENAMQFRSRPDSDSDACNFFHLCNMFDLQSLFQRSKSHILNSKLSASNDVKARIIDMAELYGDDLMTHVLSTFKSHTDLTECISLLPRAFPPAFMVRLIDESSRFIKECEKPKYVFFLFAKGRIVIQLAWEESPKACQDYLEDFNWC